MALPSSGPISLKQVRDELKLSGSISLGQQEVRNLANIPSGRISLNDLKGKSTGPATPQECDYYFETRKDFDARRNSIIVENNNDLSQKTFGFGDGVTNLDSAFKETSITSTPKMIFARNVTSFDLCFGNCHSLTTITQGLFDKCTKVTYFNYCFNNCSSLTTIPQGLFDKNVNVIDFSDCFSACSSLTTIPQGLFDKCTKVTDFDDCFSYCSSLTTIPQGLFDKCTKVYDFRYCFSNCSSLTTIPQGLFDKNINATNFIGCFKYCPEITSSLPDVWNKDKFPKVTSGSNYAIGCTKAANYNEIPAGFK